MLNFNKFVLILFIIFIIFCIIIFTIFYFIYKSTLKSNDYQKNQNQNWRENIDKEKQRFYKDETDALNNWLLQLDKKSFKAVITLVLVHYFREDIKHIKNRMETKKGKIN